MTVYRAGDIFGAGAELHRQHRLGDELRGVRTDDMDSENGVGFGVGDES